MFGTWDGWLDANLTTIEWLKHPTVAREMVKCFNYRDMKVFDLHTYCIMPNHVHVVFRPLRDSSGKTIPLPTSMHSLKSYSANQINRVIGREEALWQAESYDHVVRNEAEQHRIMWYVLNNPVKANLAKEWAEWPWSYCKYVERVVDPY